MVDPSGVDEICSLTKLSDYVSSGNFEALVFVVDKLKRKCGMQATADRLTCCDFGDRGEMSAFHRAALRGRACMLEVMLSAEARPNATDDAGCTPLHYACERGHARAVLVLLRAGADQSQANNFGKTPESFLSVHPWDAEEVRVGKAAIHKMFGDGHDGVDLDCLPDEPLPPCVDPIGSPEPSFPLSPKAKAAQRQATELLAAFARPQLPSGSRVSEHSTCAPSGISLVEEFDGTSDSRRPLALFVKNGDMEAVRRRLEDVYKEGGREFVIQEVCDVDYDDGQDSRIQPSPLHIAAVKGNVSMLRLLLDTNASPNHVNDAGDSLLHAAACQARGEVVEFLLEAGADPLQKNNFGRTPLELAATESWDTPAVSREKSRVRRSLQV